MENLSLAQALYVWSELEQAYHGSNGYGGDTAEIYAFHIMPYCPGDISKTEESVKAARTLYELLAHFRSARECKVLINGRPLGKWFTKRPFEHRCHVRIAHPTSGK